MIIVNEELLKTPINRNNVDLDAFTIMPNHIHFIIMIKNKNNVKIDPVGGPARSPLQLKIQLNPIQSGLLLGKLKP